MADSSIKSGFRFEGYKVDSMSLVSSPNLGLLGFMGGLPSDAWSMEISFRNPLFFEEANVYVGGMDVELTGSTEDGSSDEDKKIELVKIKIGIAGMFSVDEAGRFDKQTEAVLVKVQLPALLLPYLRGTVTSVLANAGFGSVILPLVNIHEMAKQSMQNVEVEVK